MFRTILIGSTLVIVAAQAAAHGVWLAERTDRTAIVVGHGHEDAAYPPSRVRSVIACGPTSPLGDVATDPTPTQTYIDVNSVRQARWIAIDYQAPAWTKFPDGTWVERRKNSGEVGITSTFSKYAVAVVRPGQGVCPEMRFMIIPEVDPLSLTPDALLPVRVLWEGRPLADVKLLGDYVGRPGEFSATTDGEGRAMVAIRNEGLNVIAAKRTLKAQNVTGIDEEESIATLSFTLTYRDPEEHGLVAPASTQ